MTAKKNIPAGLFPLLVKTRAGQLLEDCDPLTANSSETAYVVEQQHLWVTYLGKSFEVEPAMKTIDSLKKAVKAHWESNNDGRLNSDQLVVRSPSGDKGELAADTPLKASTLSAPYIVEQE